jgi:hypothetical protein
LKGRGLGGLADSRTAVDIETLHFTAQNVVRMSVLNCKTRQRTEIEKTGPMERSSSFEFSSYSFMAYNKALESFRYKSVLADPNKV